VLSGSKFTLFYHFYVDYSTDFAFMFSGNRTGKDFLNRSGAPVCMREIERADCRHA